MPECDGSVFQVFHRFVEDANWRTSCPLTFPYADGRWKSAVNMVNPLGTKGNLARSFSVILHEMWQADLPYLIPVNFRVRHLSIPYCDSSHQYRLRNQYVLMLPNSPDRINTMLKSS